MSSKTVSRNSTRLLRLLILPLVLCVGTLQNLSSAQEAPSVEHKFELAQQYYGQCESADATQFDSIRPQLMAFTDAELMAQTIADPAKFMQLMAVVNDPRTIHVMSKCATEPVMWDTWMRGLTDFGKHANAMAIFMNPNVYMNWMMAPMNPAVHQSMMQMMDPAALNRWMVASMNPVFYQPMFSFANPNWYTPRMQWMMNPNSFMPLMSTMGPPAGAQGTAPAQ